MNTNCLEDMSCPICKSEGPFEIAIRTICVVSDEGTEDQCGDNEWDDNSYCGCRGCSHSGTVGSFHTENHGNPALRDFTVVGVYDDDHQPYCDHVTATDQVQAMKDCLAKSAEVDLRILCVFDGKHNDVIEGSGDDTGWLSEDFEGDQPMCNKRTNESGEEEFFDGTCWMGDRDVCNHCRDQREAEGKPYRYADWRHSFGCYAGRYCDACWTNSGYRDATNPNAEWSAEDAGEAMYEDEY